MSVFFRILQKKEKKPAFPTPEPVRKLTKKEKQAEHARRQKVRSGRIRFTSSI